jgi:hypothetical protein
VRPALLKAAPTRIQEVRASGNPNATAFDAIRVGTSTEDARIELVFGSTAMMCIREPDTQHWFAALSNIRSHSARQARQDRRHDQVTVTL